ncbi:MAG: lauroyl acyltransferase, partial [Zetaproteobacteria bacterium]|nr:lauroyl acyltransferase [Zetaproteobacteria bacterium]
MSDWLSYKSFIYAIGFLAQILFSARLLLQWIKSEKAKRVLTPQLFWELSLMASFLLFVYGWLRDDFAIMLGQILAYFIYIRNMQLQGSWQKLPLLLRWFLSAFPLLVIVYSFNNNAYDLDRLFKNEAIST